MRFFCREKNLISNVASGDLRNLIYLELKFVKILKHDFALNSIGKSTRGKQEMYIIIF